MCDAKRQCVPGTVGGEGGKGSRDDCGRNGVEGHVAVSECVPERCDLLALTFGHDENAGANEISVGEPVADAVFDGVGEVVFAALFGSRMTDLVTELDFEGQQVEEYF